MHAEKMETKGRQMALKQANYGLLNAWEFYVAILSDG